MTRTVHIGRDLIAQGWPIDSNGLPIDPGAQYEACTEDTAQGPVTLIWRAGHRIPKQRKPR